MCAKGFPPVVPSVILTRSTGDDNVEPGGHRARTAARPTGTFAPLRCGLLLFAFVLGITGCGVGDQDSRVGSSRHPAASPSVELLREEASAPGELIHVGDDAGRVLTFSAPPRRIVSLVPSATEILLALGKSEALVARTDFDRIPALQHLPSVGGGLGASLEAILAAQPDLVVLFHGPSDAATPARLDAYGVPYLAIRPDGIADVFRIIELLGRVTSVPASADSLRRSLEGELEEIRIASAGRWHPTVTILLGGNPPLVASQGTFLHELVELAGGRNVLDAQGDLYTPTSVEEILLQAPDLLLLSEGAALPNALGHLPVRRLPAEVQIPGIALGASARLIFSLLHESLLHEDSSP